jgi:hypothetical protein
MGKSLLTLLIFGLCFSIHGQELMTIGDVFNFEIGDEFQIEGAADNEPPNIVLYPISRFIFNLC